MDLCLTVERHMGSRVTKRWRDQEGLDLEGMRMAAQEAEREEGGEDMNGMEMDTDD